MPEGATAAHFVGFFCEDEGLTAVMDLVLGYPQGKTAVIRWFMVAADKQRQGVGSALFADVRASLAAQGYTHLELRIPEGAEEALAFWDVQGFAATGERDDSGRYPVITLAREI
jgi:GNAT superfamily N-acetyltransferase